MISIIMLFTNQYHQDYPAAIHTLYKLHSLIVGGGGGWGFPTIHGKADLLWIININEDRRCQFM